MTDHHILLVEDEPDLRLGLAHNLQIEGFRVDAAADGATALERMQATRPDLVVLDLMLPGLSGLDVLRYVREQYGELPVIVLSARNSDRDKVSGLDLGADDYVTKPFALPELTARIRAVLRRAQPAQPDSVRTVWHFRDLTVDFRRFSVTRGGKERQLSHYEAEILRMLVAHRGEVVTRSDLLTTVWGYKRLPNTRTVDNHIARLRKKVEIDVELPVHVLTVHGLGYRFEADLATEDQR